MNFKDTMALVTELEDQHSQQTRHSICRRFWDSVCCSCSWHVDLTFDHRLGSPFDPDNDKADFQIWPYEGKMIG